MADDVIGADSAALLAAVAEAAGPKFRDLGTEAARAAYRQMSAALDTPPVDRCPVRDLAIALPGRTLAARLYGGAGPVTMLTLYFHGGGWVAGDLETHDAFCRDLALAVGGHVLALDYRLAPEHRFPAAHDDCLAVARLARSGGLLPGAPPPPVIGLAGDSAGGNLAASTALALAAQGDAGAIAAQLLFYPVIDLCAQSPSYARFAEGMLLERADMAFFIDSYAPSREDRIAASPSHAADLSLAPPTVIATCSLDPLRDEGRAFAARLIAAGVPVTFVELRGIPHGAVTLRLALPSALPMIGDAIARYAQLLRAADAAAPARSAVA